MKFKVCAVLGSMLMCAVAGCFYPPTAEPLADSKTSAVVHLPYDLTWTAVNDVISQNGYKIQAQDPNHGIIEVSGDRFNLQDADCGRIKSIVGAYAAEPEADSTSVYNFQVKPITNESSRVDISATFESPLKVPLRPTKDIQCVSLGASESRLLREILAQASVTHPPEYRESQQSGQQKQAAQQSQAAQSQAAPSQSAQPFTIGPRRPTLLGPDILKLPGMPNPPPDTP